MGRPFQRERVIDYDEKYLTVTAATAAETTVFAFQVKPGKQPWLAFVGNAIQAGGGDLVTFVLRVNRANFYPFDGSLNQWAPPESNFDLPVPYELPVGCEVSVVAINADSGTTYAATARIKIFYTDFEKYDVG